MEITITNFRSIRKEKYFFNEGITLIDGESGKGKTTIIEAVYWCLYGGGNNYPFKYNLKTKEFTKVELKLNDIKIFRTKPPDNVSITIKDSIFNNDEAQTNINRIFGSQSYWESSSYLKQDNRNILMSTIKSNDKIKILKEIIFGKNNEDIVQEYYNKLEKYLKETEKEIILNNTESNLYTKIFEESSSNFKNYENFQEDKKIKIYKRKTDIEKSLDNVKNNIEKLVKLNHQNETLDDFKIKKIESEKLLKKYPENLDFKKINKWQKYIKGKEELENYNNDFEIDNSDFEEINKIYKNLKENQEYFQKNIKLSEKINIEYDENIITNKIKELENLVENIIKYKNYKETFENIKKLEEDIEKKRQLVHEFKILKKNTKPSLDIEEKISTLDKEMEKYKIYETYLVEKNKLDVSINSLREMKLKSLEIKKRYMELLKCLDFPYSEINPEIRYKIKDTINSCSGKFLKCPSCNTYLCKKGKNLQEIDFKPFDEEKKNFLLNELEKIFEFNNKYKNLKEKIKDEKIPEVLKPSIEKEEIILEIKKYKKELKNSIDIEKNYIEEKKSLKLLLETFNKFKIPEKVSKKEGDVKKIKNDIFFLKSINFYKNKEEELIEISSKLENIKKTMELEKIKTKISENYLDFFDIFETPFDFESYFSEYKSCLEKNNVILEYLKNHKKIEYNGLPIENLEEKKKELEKLLTDCDEFEKYLKIKKDKLNMTNSKESLKKSVEKKEACIRLKKIIDESSSESLEILVSELNELLNEISNELFEDITIELDMFKKMKVKKDLKSQFNLLIHLKGNTYDNISCLSGGEKDRISICLTLALSKLSGNPLIFLDECMSSLDEEMRSRVLELIKKYAPEKIVVNVCHDSIQGYYDNIIKL